MRELLEEAARGRFPPADGTLEILPAPEGPAVAAVVALTGRHVVAAPLPEAAVRAMLPDGDDLLAPMSPRFLAWLGAELGARDDGVDVLLAAPGLDGPSSLSEVGGAEHPRVARALAHREDVRVFEAGPAVIVLGRGLARRREVAVEVPEASRGAGVARAALIEARRMVGAGEVLFAQTAPGNAASLRALLAAGFVPIGSEALFF